MFEMSTIWNLLLSAGIGGVVWWVRNVNTQIHELRSTITATREKMAVEYALKVDVDKDVQKLLDRFDRMETKLDSLIDKIIQHVKH